MKRLHVGRGQYTKLDDCDYRSAKPFLWHVSRQRTGYAVRSVRLGGKNVFIFLHKLIANPPRGKSVDHINGDKLDNRRKNLRICAHKQNMKNMGKNKTKKSSRYKGVYPQGKKWRVLITSDGVAYYRGGFFTQKEAALAYNFMAKKLHKQFACLNKV